MYNLWNFYRPLPELGYHYSYQRRFLVAKYDFLICNIEDHNHMPYNITTSNFTNKSSNALNKLTPCKVVFQGLTKVKADYELRDSNDIL